MSNQKREKNQKTQLITDESVSAIHQGYKQYNINVAEKINNQIDSNNKKIAELMGDYATNTYKRIKEQETRDHKISLLKVDNCILNHLIDCLDNDEPLTKLENTLINNGIFRNSIAMYCKAYKHNPSTCKIKYPEINLESAKDSCYNIDVKKRLMRMNRAGITDTSLLMDAVQKYTKIIDIATKPIDQKLFKITKLERKCKMMQKGDINFTSPKVAKYLIKLASINCNSNVLEPSAGIGAIADEIKNITSNIDVVEYMCDFRELLELKGYNLVGNNFLEYIPIKKYNAIIMNPPFSDEQNHIKHAFSMLEDGGVLVSITSPHWTFANDKKSINFRDWVNQKTHYTEDLASGAFEMTKVSTKILFIKK